MAHNYLEQLVAEWYQYNGYFIQRNVHVGPLPHGGYECELDVVAFNPRSGHLLHIEPSMDAHSWTRRAERCEKKFAAGRKYIPELFNGLPVHSNIEQIALLVYASNKIHTTLAGGQVMLLPEFLQAIFASLSQTTLARSAVPEQYPLIRTLQVVSDHRNLLLPDTAHTD
jgi:hypothetical protein